MVEAEDLEALLKQEEITTTDVFPIGSGLVKASGALMACRFYCYIC